MKEVVVSGAARTAMGGFQGDFNGVDAAVLGGAAIRAALQDAGTDTVEEVLMGCVLPAGHGQAPARQSGFHGGLGEEVPATTINKMCGSGMKTAMMAYDRIALGHAGTMIAGGMENMSNAPYIIPKMRDGARMGHSEVKDHMFLDGLEDAYEKGRLMGTFAEDCAARYQFSREEQDAYAIESLERALRAQEDGSFDNEITQVVVSRRKGDMVVDKDEQPGLARPAHSSFTLWTFFSGLLFCGCYDRITFHTLHPQVEGWPGLPCRPSAVREFFGADGGCPRRVRWSRSRQRPGASASVQLHGGAGDVGGGGYHPASA